MSRTVYLSIEQFIQEAMINIPSYMRTKEKEKWVTEEILHDIEWRYISTSLDKSGNKRITRREADRLLARYSDAYRNSGRILY